MGWSIGATPERPPERHGKSWIRRERRRKHAKIKSVEKVMQMAEQVKAYWQKKHFSFPQRQIVLAMSNIGKQLEKVREVGKLNGRLDNTGA